MVSRGVVSIGKGSGGAEHVAYELARHLAERGDDVILVADVDAEVLQQSPPTLSVAPVGRYRSLAWLAAHVPLDFPRWILQHLLGNIRAASRARQLLRSDPRGFDAVHVARRAGHDPAPPDGQHRRRRRPARLHRARLDAVVLPVSPVVRAAGAALRLPPDQPEGLPGGDGRRDELPGAGRRDLRARRDPPLALHDGRERDRGGPAGQSSRCGECQGPAWLRQVLPVRRLAGRPQGTGHPACARCRR